jgi:transcriptional regulator with XRE-family HTH domain
MAERLGATCRDARQAAGLSLLDIATRADVSQTTIHYFETDGTYWSPKTDVIVNAYARETGRRARDLWQEALDRR